MTPDIILLQQDHVTPVRRFSLRDGRYTLGRSADCHIVVDHVTVSRRHCEIWVSGGRIRVYDLGSRNGTYIDDRPVKECHVVGKGQKLRCGDVTFVLELDPRLVEDADSEPETSECEESDEGTPALAQISAAQNRVLQELLKGLSDKEIARHLKISPKTVHLHVQAIFRTLSVHSRPELLATFLPTLATKHSKSTKGEKE